MTKQELIKMYDERYNRMAQSGDVYNMHVFGAATRKMFDKLSDTYPDFAGQVLNDLEAVCYNNYLTAEEAKKIGDALINDDAALTDSHEHTTGVHWSEDEVKNLLASKGLSPMKKPYYNWWALWLTINVMYSDYVGAINKMTNQKNGEQIALWCYELAIRKLCDVDRPRWIRAYFNLDSQK